MEADETDPETIGIADASRMLEESDDEDDSRHDQNEEVVIKMEAVTEGAEGSDFVEENASIISNMNAEVKPASVHCRNKHQGPTAIEATESDDVIRNIDVITKLRQVSRKKTADWMLRHTCCPENYREKIKTDEGYSNAVHILLMAIVKISNADAKKSRKKEKSLRNAFRQTHFKFPPWREASGRRGDKEREKNERIRKMRQADYEQRQELRHQLTMKEKQLRTLKAERELAPTDEFLKICEISKKRKKAAEFALREAQKELQAVSKAHDYYSQKLPEVRTRKKNQHNILIYYKNRLKTVAAMGSNAEAALRKNAATKELLDYEKGQLKLIKADGRVLQNEQDELECQLDELKDTSFFDAMTGEASDDELETSQRQSASRRYKPEMMETIKELLEIGVPIESVQSVFESIFESINFPVQRFPTCGIIHRMLIRFGKK